MARPLSAGRCRALRALWALALFTSELMAPEVRTLAAEEAPSSSSTATTLLLPSNKSITAKSPSSHLASAELGHIISGGGSSVPSDIANFSVSNTEVPSASATLMEEPRGVSISVGRPGSNLSSREHLSSTSRALDRSSSTLRDLATPSAGHPAHTLPSSTIAASAQLRPEGFQAQATEKLIPRTEVATQYFYSSSEEQPAVWNASTSAAPMSSSSSAVPKTIFPKNFTEAVETSSDGAPARVRVERHSKEKVKPRVVRETLERDLFEETDKIDDNLMLPSSINERLVKWQEPGGALTDVAGRHSDNLMSPSGEQKTLYARRLEYTLPSTYAVLYKKVYSSKQGLSSFPSYEIPKQRTQEKPRLVSEEASNLFPEIYPKTTSTEREHARLLEKSRPAVRPAAQNSPSHSFETTSRPVLGTRNESKFLFMDDEDSAWERQFDNKTDSVWAKEEKQELEPKNAPQRGSSFSQQKQENVATGRPALQTEDLLRHEQRAVPHSSRDPARQRALRTASSSPLGRGLTIPSFEGLGAWRPSNAIAVQQWPSESSPNAAHSSPLTTETLISTDMLADSSLHDIRLKMKRQLKIDDANLKLNSMYVNGLEKNSVQEQSPANKASRNATVESKRAGFRAEKARKLRREKSRAPPTFISNKESEVLKPTRRRFAGTSERQNNINHFEAAGEGKFSTGGEVPSQSMPREINSYSFAPRFHSPEGNDRDRPNYDQEANTSSSERQGVSPVKYHSSAYGDPGVDWESPKRKVPTVKYEHQPQASSRERLRDEELGRGKASLEYPRGGRGSSYTEPTNLSNKRKNQQMHRHETEPPHSIRRNDYDSNYAPGHERRTSHQNTDGNEAKHYEDYELAPDYDANYPTDSEDDPQILDYNEISDTAHRDHRPTPEAPERKHNAQSKSRHQGRQDANYSAAADQRGRPRQHAPHSPHKPTAAKESRSSPQHGSQPAKDDNVRGPPTLFDHALQVAAATGKKLISPLLYLPDTQAFPRFETFGDFGNFKQ